MTTEEDWWVKEYAKDIHDYLRVKERKRFIYRGQSQQLGMRRGLVDWLDAVCNKMEFCTTVQHLAVYLLDIFMDNHIINCEHLRMVSIGCLIVAVKLEEKDSLIPKNSEFNALLENKYKLLEFVQMEVSVLNFFNWDILFPTAAHFAEYYSLHAIRPSDDYNESPLQGYDRIKMYVQKYIDYFLEVAVRDVIFLKFHPSLVAASCVASTRMCLVLTPTWPLYLQNITHYKFTHLKACVSLLLRALDVDIQSKKGSGDFSENTYCKAKDCMTCDNSDDMLISEAT